MIPILMATLLVAGTTANSPIRINFENQPILSGSSYTRVGRKMPSFPSLYSPPPSLSPPSYSQSSTSPISYYSSAPSAVSPSSYYSSSSSSPYLTSDRNAAITSYTRDVQHSNSDKTSFTTSNGISSSHNVQVIHGPSSYQDHYGQTVQTDSTISMNGHSYHKSPEGMHVSLTWNADENGFIPQGDHLPQPVSLPPDHAEAHRQALLAAAQTYSSYSLSSSDGGYRDTSSSSSAPPGPVDHGGVYSSSARYVASSSISAPTFSGYGGSSSSSSKNNFGKYGPPATSPSTSTSYTSYNAPIMPQTSNRPPASQQSGYGYY